MNNTIRFEDNIDRVKNYKWTVKDKPGKIGEISKQKLLINHNYQRNLNESKVLKIASDWSWIALGSISVAFRDGNYYVMDGQHRVAAALKRKDIDYLPCIVFTVNEIKEEAQGFLDSNTLRKPVTAFGKYKALLLSGDETALFVEKTLSIYQIELLEGYTKPKSISTISLCLKRAKENPERFELIIGLLSVICNDSPILEILLDGLWYLDQNLDHGLFEKRLQQRIKQVGATKMTDGAKKAVAYYAKGGNKIWGTGILEELNKGIKTKFELK